MNQHAYIAVMIAGIGGASLTLAVRAEPIRKPFDIAAGPAVPSIAAFAAQAGVNVLADGNQLAEVTTNPVKGTLDVAEALHRLLLGTGFTSTTTASGAILVSAMERKPRAPSRPPAPVVLPACCDMAGAPLPAVDVVLVSGTRQAVISAIERKKTAATISDAIVAEDIGQFPDKNIGEALSRMTGVQISSEFGEGSQISIRGIQPDLNRIEINGMSVLSTVDSGMRAPDLRDLPSELIRSIDVIKGVTADTTEGSIGGAVAITTNRPLDFKQFTIATTASAERNSLRGGTQPRGNLLIADRFLDGRLGLMANLVYDQVLTQADRVRNSGWRFLRDWDLSDEKTVVSTNPAAAAVTERNGCTTLTGTSRSDCERQWYDYSPSAARYGILRRDHRRETAELTAQYQFSRDLTAFASVQRYSQDSWFSDLNYQTDLTSVDRLASAGNAPVYNSSGVPSGGSCMSPDTASTPAGMVITNHRVTEYVVGDCLALAGRGGANAFSTQARSFQQRVDTDYRSAGFKWRRGAWDVEGLLVRSDGHYRNDSNFLGLWMNVPGLKVTLDQRGFPHFTFPSGISPLDAGAYTQVQYTYNPVELDSAENQFKLDLRYRTGLPLIDKVSFGVQARSARSLRFADGGYIINPGSNLSSTADDLSVLSPNVRYTWNYDPLNPTTALRPATSQSYIDANNKELWISSAQMQQLVQAISGTSPDFLRGAGVSGFPANWVAPSVAEAMTLLSSSALNHDSLRQARGSDGQLYSQIPSYGVQEHIRAAYLRLDYDDQLFGYPVSGNFGVRYAGTRSRSIGRQRLLMRVERAAGSTSYDDIQIANTLVGKDNVYHDFLPSFNAAAWLAPEALLLRLGYGKVIARPGLDRISPNFTCTINSGNPQFGGDGVDDCSGGNPDLQPYRAASKDLSLEWYPARDAQLSLAYFRKDISNAIQSNVTVRKDLLGDGKVFDITTTVNFPGATTKGIELAGQAGLTFLPGALSGFGVSANYTRMAFDYARNGTLTNPLDGSVLPFPGMSRTAYNVALWYDKAWLNARLAYNRRDAYYTGSNDTATGNPLFAAATGFLDAKIQYRIDRHFSIALEAKNLTNESTLTTAGAITRPNEYSWSGRRYYVSLAYNY